MTTTETGVDAATARVADLWREYRSGPVPTRLEAMIDGYPDGAAGYVADLEMLARAWVRLGEMTEAERVAAVMGRATSPATELPRRDQPDSRAAPERQ